ncbi:MAG: ISKra4 family transposase [Planctomycetota bacterium]|jgi:hypothetical protein
MALAAAQECEDPFGMARDDLESIIAFLRSAEAGRMSHSDLERLVRERSHELLRKLFQAHVDSRGPGEAAATVRGADGVERDQERSHDRALTTIFGEIRVKRLGYGTEGADSLHPLDAELNLPRERYSFGLRQAAAVHVSKGSFDEAVASLARDTGAVVGKRQVEELARRAAQDFDAFYSQRAPPVGDRSTSVLAITVDGKGVVMLRRDLREATKKAAEKGSRRLGKRLTRGEKRNRKRMATVTAVYTVEPFVRQPEDVIRVLAPRDEREMQKRPRPQDKRVWASLAKQPEQVLAQAFAEAERRDPSHRKSWIALVDGNSTQLEILHKLAGRHRVELTIVLDFIHVCEYVWKASLGFYEETEPARQAWVQERLLRILRGEASLVAAGMRRSATRRELKPDERENVDRCADYLLNYAPYLHYHEYLTAGFPIATGVIEGACRHLVSDRMDLTGARWSLAGAEAVLRLRALRSSGDFEEYWRFHEQREYERNHASRYVDGKVVPVKGRHLKRVK